jgi:DNA-binding LacI/PurR family transcriptional regulator
MSHLLYLDIASALRGRIARGEFVQGKLPSERELTGEFGVQRATIRRALKALEEEGLVFRDATRGTFADPRVGRPSVPSTASSVGRGNIALIIGRAADTTAPGDIARGLAHAVDADGRSVVWFDAPSAAGHAEAQAPRPADLLDRGASAAVLWPQIPADVATLRALRAAMPLVLLDRRVPGFESDFVGIHDFAAARMMAEHLLRVGHRAIGFLGVSPLVGTVQARSRGWAAALTDAGITPRPEWTMLRQGADLDPSADAAALTLFLEGGGEPLSAVVCSNDTVAAGLLRFLQAAKRRVPDDVAVTGFGDSFPQLLDALGLTTVAQPWEEVGRAAGQIVLERMSSGAPGGAFDYHEVEIPVSLVVRGSCGTASSAKEPPGLKGLTP